MSHSVCMESPVGLIALEGDAHQLTAIRWGSAQDVPSPPLAEAKKQLAEYFAHGRTSFDLPIALPPVGSFQNRFLRALLAIPFGQTRTYGEIAKDLGAPAQAIGQACGGNPIPIVIPCHRVLATGGLGGYSGAGGIETKVSLLKHEGAASLLI